MTEIHGRALLFETSVMRGCEEHCSSVVDVEVGGFLLGSVSETQVTVSDFYPAARAESSQTNLKFTHEVWDDILGKLDSSFMGLSIVGWYHSHPGFGCFLSDYDAFIQENFFSGPGQLALVIDPLAGSFGIFSASDGSITEVESGQTLLPAIAPSDDPSTAIELKATEHARDVAYVPSKRRWPLIAAATASAFGFGIVLSWLFIGIANQDQIRLKENQLLESQGKILALEQELNVAQEQMSEEQAPETQELIVEPTTPVIEEEVVALVPVIIRRGDTLWHLAERFLGDGRNYVDILEWNPGVSPLNLQPGDRVFIKLPVTMSGKGIL